MKAALWWTGNQFRVNNEQWTDEPKLPKVTKHPKCLLPSDDQPNSSRLLNSPCREQRFPGCWSFSPQSLFKLFLIGRHRDSPWNQFVWSEVKHFSLPEAPSDWSTVQKHAASFQTVWQASSKTSGHEVLQSKQASPVLQTSRRENIAGIKWKSECRSS